MSRKVMKTMGQRRRSPRISALDKSKDDHQTSSRTCRAKRSLENAAALPPLSKLAKQVWKGRDSPENADCVEWRSVKEDQKGVTTTGKACVMPAKHILELVLDTLQRRDTHEIFAQPVDAHEVEEYYEIIKEPMDFGTMRAKLHEGMYQDLQQFEHDVFLIPENAMHFNSSRTIYFRQARAIHELANKVFHVLKTKPESFVSEFSGSRRRSMRKALSETIQTSTFRRSSNRKSPPKRTGSENGAAAAGGGESSSNSNSSMSRRETYYYMSKDADDPLLVTTSQPLALGLISYKESLMSYAKELGPTAQAVAKRKLLGEHEHSKSKTTSTSSSSAVEFKTFRDFAGCTTSNPFATMTVTVKGNWMGDKEKAKKEIPRNNYKPPISNSNRNCSVILALENHHSHRFKSRHKIHQQHTHHSKPPLPSHFTFDLPFLQSRLRHINPAPPII